jgi:chaperonin GroES
LAKQCKFRPLGNHVVLVRDQAADQSPGGIYIPDEAKEKQTRGIVVAVGPGRRSKTASAGEELDRVDVKVGDRVVFSSYSANDIDVDGEKYAIVDGDSIMGVIL